MHLYSVQKPELQYEKWQFIFLIGIQGLIFVQKQIERQTVPWMDNLVNRRNRDIADVWEESSRLYLKSRADGKQNDEAINRNPCPPDIDHPELAAFVHEDNEAVLRHVTAAPENDTLRNLNRKKRDRFELRK